MTRPAVGRRIRRRSVHNPGLHYFFCPLRALRASSIRPSARSESEEERSRNYYKEELRVCDEACSLRIKVHYPLKLGFNELRFSNLHLNGGMKQEHAAAKLLCLPGFLTSLKRQHCVVDHLPSIICSPSKIDQRNVLVCFSQP